MSNKERAENMANILCHEDYYYSSNLLQRFFEETRIKHVLQLCGDIKDKNVLEIGVGDGFMIKELKCDDLWGIDISLKRVIRSKDRIPKALLSVQDIHQTGFKDNSFDVVVCADVLEHVDNPSQAIKEISRIVKKNGSVVVSVPNEKVFILLRFMMLRLPPFNPDHVHSLHPKILIKYFGSVPTVVFNIPNLPYPFCIEQCYKFLPNK